jgi:hypothetical protein
MPGRDRCGKDPFIDNLSTQRLPPSSMYTPGKDAIEAVISAEAVRENFVPVEGYAEQVVKNALKRSPAKRL